MTGLMTENGISHMVTLCPLLVINPSHISYVLLVVLDCHLAPPLSPSYGDYSA